ncbi:sigma-70 family RNA polymerase sigma factor [Lacticaseibacillus mingshuiensis]|uniref:Sigma-70 family RNA polymerase sigma factor n=1 Tax=Lacticaseibacillus mingshuiensis TaxID=2799574 RepID=A0ABW4CGI0_9LACO|nr:sigma-70 family RNA polymerase sigma factor [Lacticaseibacillus mingshuiensis]
MIRLTQSQALPAASSRELRLVTKAIKGDQTVFAALMHAQSAYLVKTAKLYLARDADVQEVIGETTLAALKSIHSLKDPALFRTWLTRIMIRQTYHHYDVNAHEAVDINALPDVPAQIEWASSEQKLDLLAGLRQLNDQYRQVLLLYYYHGLSISEIASVTEQSDNTVKSQLRRGKAQLKAWLGGDYFEG